MGEVKKFFHGKLTTAAQGICNNNNSFLETLKHIHVCNIGSVAASFTVLFGLSGSQLEFLKDVVVQPGKTYDWYGAFRMVGANGVTTIQMHAQASVTNTLTMLVCGERDIP